jgi:S-adenosylhomocysteine hydrolase
MNPVTYLYPLLKEITLHYLSKKDTQPSGVYLCACQHLLEPQEKMFDLISEFGIPKENIFILGKAYSTNIDVLLELQRKNFQVAPFSFKPEESFDKQHKENCEQTFDEFISHVPTKGKIIFLDDGGQLLEIANNNYQWLAEKANVIGIEQTSSGFNRLKNTELHFPIINVARSSTKLIKESPVIAKLGLERIKEVFHHYGVRTAYSCRRAWRNR